MIPSTTQRVPEHTPASYNERIRNQTEENIAVYAAASSEAIEERLRQLDEEWDIERTLEANAASVSLLGLGLGALVDRRFYVLPTLVAGFLLQHSLQGWCPPMPLLRRLGYRTQPEIERERHALKAARGDYAGVDRGGSPVDGSETSATS